MRSFTGVPPKSTSSLPAKSSPLKPGGMVGGGGGGTWAEKQAAKKAAAEGAAGGGPTTTTPTTTITPGPLSGLTKAGVEAPVLAPKAEPPFFKLTSPLEWEKLWEDESIATLQAHLPPSNDTHSALPFYWSFMAALEDGDVFHLAGMSALLNGEFTEPTSGWGDTPLQATLSRLAVMGSWLKTALEKEDGGGSFPWGDHKTPLLATTPSPASVGEGGEGANALLLQQQAQKQEKFFQEDKLFQEALEKASVAQGFPRGRTRRRKPLPPQPTLAAAAAAAATAAAATSSVPSLTLPQEGSAGNAAPLSTGSGGGRASSSTPKGFYFRPVYSTLPSPKATPSFMGATTNTLSNSTTSASTTTTPADSTSYLPGSVVYDDILGTTGLGLPTPHFHQSQSDSTPPSTTTDRRLAEVSFTSWALPVASIHAAHAALEEITASQAHEWGEHMASLAAARAAANHGSARILAVAREEAAAGALLAARIALRQRLEGSLVGVRAAVGVVVGEVGGLGARAAAREEALAVAEAVGEVRKEAAAWGKGELERVERETQEGLRAVREQGVDKVRELGDAAAEAAAAAAAASTDKSGGGGGGGVRKVHHPPPMQSSQLKTPLASSTSTATAAALEDLTRKIQGQLATMTTQGIAKALFTGGGGGGSHQHQHQHPHTPLTPSTKDLIAHSLPRFATSTNPHLRDLAWSLSQAKARDVLEGRPGEASAASLAKLQLQLQLRKEGRVAVAQQQGQGQEQEQQAPGDLGGGKVKSSGTTGPVVVAKGTLNLAFPPSQVHRVAALLPSGRAVLPCGVNAPYLGWGEGGSSGGSSGRGGDFELGNSARTRGAAGLLVRAFLSQRIMEAPYDPAFGAALERTVDKLHGLLRARELAMGKDGGDFYGPGVPTPKRPFAATLLNAASGIGGVVGGKAAPPPPSPLPAPYDPDAWLDAPVAPGKGGGSRDLHIQGFLAPPSYAIARNAPTHLLGQRHY